MTDAEKLADYDSIVAIIKDELSLEKYYVRKRKTFDVISLIRAEAYKKIVDAVIGVHALPGR
jgi:hypothetical protein